jgi:rhodanese-related sulfurtransferase
MRRATRTAIAPLAALLVLAAAAGCVRRPALPAAASVPPQNVVRRIAIDDVLARRAAGEAVVIVDTRDRIVGPMVKDAVHVPISRITSWAKTQPRDTVVVTYCNCLHEATAAHAVLKLQQEGFTNAYALLDGFRGWAAKGLPLEIRR